MERFDSSQVSASADTPEAAHTIFIVANKKRLLLFKRTLFGDIAGHILTNTNIFH
jgi:hypothetical protein